MADSTCRCGIAVFIVFLILQTAPLPGVTNIDTNDRGSKFGWTENGGWINLQGDVNDGVHVGSTFLQGFAWHENFGWINFGNGAPVGETYSNQSSTDFGVNIDSAGNLSGYAWGENIGWIAFDTTTSGGSRVTINQQNGRFAGYAWSENAGWVSFETVDPAFVATVPGFTGAVDWTLFE